MCAGAARPAAQQGPHGRGARDLHLEITITMINILLLLIIIITIIIIIIITVIRNNNNNNNNNNNMIYYDTNTNASTN